VGATALLQGVGRHRHERLSILPAVGNRHPSEALDVGILTDLRDPVDVLGGGRTQGETAIVERVRQPKTFSHGYSSLAWGAASYGQLRTITSTLGVRAESASDRLPIPTGRRDLVAGDLPRVRLVGVTAVSDGDDAHGAVVSELVDDAVDADPVGPKPGEPSAQLVTEVRVAFELTERIQDRVGS
jgi:hypothetical protein